MVFLSNGNNGLIYRRKLHNRRFDCYDHILCQCVGNELLRKRYEQQKSGNGNGKSVCYRLHNNGKRRNHLFRIDNNADGKRKQRYKSGI